MTDHGFTHIALECHNLDRSISFYERFGGFEVVHRRDGVAWISDQTRPFAIVLSETDEVHPFGPFPHVGIACRDRATFDGVVELARGEGCLRTEPSESTGPAGTWAFIDDPDGNTFEVSVGQSVELAIRESAVPSGARRLPVVGVLGSGTVEHAEVAEPLGKGLADLGVHLLTGGGGGVMRAVARGFTSVSARAGLSLGILPGNEDGEAPPGYPNEFIELSIRTHLPLSGDHGTDARSRNHVNVLSATAIVMLPGGAGTASELTLAQQYGTPVLSRESWTSIDDVVAWVREVGSPHA